MNIIEIASQHRIVSLTALGVLGLFLAVGLFMKTKKVSPIGWGLFGPYNAEAGLALAGHDPLSYRMGEPQLGMAEYQSKWKGVTWRFMSAEHKARFDAAPEKYAPANGGFCSFAASKGFTANSNPQSYLVQEGTLFVFDSDAMKEKFVAQLSENIALSQKKWAAR
jgi:YHS domain-containing protein